MCNTFVILRTKLLDYVVNVTSPPTTVLILQNTCIYFRVDESQCFRYYISTSHTSLLKLPTSRNTYHCTLVHFQCIHCCMYRYNFHQYSYKRLLDGTNLFHTHQYLAVKTTVSTVHVVIHATPEVCQYSAPYVVP